jgi:hypothetical protein
VRHGNHPALSLACTVRRWPRRIDGFMIKVEKFTSDIEVDKRTA